jgi:hypothetical protein
MLVPWTYLQHNKEPGKDFKLPSVSDIDRRNTSENIGTILEDRLWYPMFGASAITVRLSWTAWTDYVGA